MGAVSSTHWLASGTAMAILEKGGNAFDAVTAAGFVLQVVEPHYNGLGGDVSVLAYKAADRRTTAVCGQGPMPRTATPGHFHALGLRQIPGSGLLPAVVPGAMSAWMRLLGEYGSLPLRDVLDAAIGYATDGFPLLPDTARAIQVLAPLFRTEWAESGRTYLQGGEAPRAGARFRNSALAGTYQRLLREAETASSDREAQIGAAENAFYQGFVAEAVDAFTSGAAVLDATGRKHHGLLTGQDMATWRATIDAPALLTYGNLAVHKPGPWSQGPVFLQQLALLGGFDLRAMGLGSAEYIHTVAECAKLAFADREAWYGDPAHSDVPLDTLLSPAYTAARRELVGSKAAMDLRPGSPGGRQPWIPVQQPDELPPADSEWMAQMHSGLPTIVQATAARGDTCTIAVADRHGNLVVAVPSGGWLKSSPVVPGLGFSLGTRGQTMTLAEGHPNSLAPGRRPRTTLSPTLVLRDDEPYLAFGTPGGDRQDQWTLGFHLAVTEFGLDLQSAVGTLAFHTDHFPSSFTPHESRPGVLVVEENCDPSTVDALRRRGHEVELAPAFSLGKVCAVGVDPEHRFLRAAASPRGSLAYAVGR